MVISKKRFMKKNTFALIPARSGSKRIKEKNIKNFFGKPIIAYSIKAALDSNLFEQVIVSTDSKKIASIAKSYGAKTPFLRPKNISCDFSDIKTVKEHFLEYLKTKNIKITFLCTLLATAPFLSATTLQDAFFKLEKSKKRECLSVCKMPSSIQRSFYLNSNETLNMFSKENFTKRSQDLKEAYFDAGQFSFENLQIKKEKNYFSDEIIAYKLDSSQVEDIDTESNWLNAKLKYKVLTQKSNIKKNV